MKTTKSNTIDSTSWNNVNSNKKYFNIPRFFDHDFYRVAADKFVEKYSALQDVLSIYLFGQVSVEGISDLDFIVVLKDPQVHQICKENSIMSFNEDLRYIYNCTQPFLVNEEVFKNFWKIFPTSNLQLIYGKDLRQELNSEEKNALPSYNTLILIDVCNNFYPHIFLTQLFSQQLNVRYSLLILNSLKFPLRMFMDISGCTTDDWIKFINNVKKLRESWFNIEDKVRYQELYTTLKEAIEISLDLIGKLDSYVKTNLWSYSSSEIVSLPKTLGKTFISPFNKDKLLDEEYKSFIKHKNLRSFSPLSFYFPLLVYSQNQGLVSGHIKSHLPKKHVAFEINNKTILPYMKDRIVFMNKHALFYKENKIKINMVHNYYGYNHLASIWPFLPLFQKIYRLKNKVTARCITWRSQK